MFHQESMTLKGVSPYTSVSINLIKVSIPSCCPECIVSDGRVEGGQWAQCPQDMGAWSVAAVCAVCAPSSLI